MRKNIFSLFSFNVFQISPVAKRFELKYCDHFCTESSPSSSTIESAHFSFVRSSCSRRGEKRQSRPFWIWREVKARKIPFARCLNNCYLWRCNRGEKAKRAENKPRAKDNKIVINCFTRSTLQKWVFLVLIVQEISFDCLMIGLRRCSGFINNFKCL